MHLSIPRQAETGSILVDHGRSPSPHARNRCLREAPPSRNGLNDGGTMSGGSERATGTPHIRCHRQFRCRRRCLRRVVQNKLGRKTFVFGRGDAVLVHGDQQERHPDQRAIGAKSLVANIVQLARELPFVRAHGCAQNLKPVEGAVGLAAMADAEVVANNHHDEEVEISDAESVPDNQDESEPSDGEDAPAGARGACHL
jgi:hypothetical protein